jgi:hypothetical protein
MWLTMILFVIPMLMTIIAVALVYGSSRWQSASKEMHTKLEVARRPIGSKTYSSDELNGLPTPVQRYFRAVLKDGQPIVSAVSVEHAGTFNISENGEQWKPFTSTERVITQRPGFDWEGRIVMMPGLTLRVHDAYIAGEGILHATLFGLVSLVNLRGTTDIAQGELMRFLAETIWYPTALLPSQGVHWEAVDNTSAKATLKDGETTLTMLFRFNENGLIESGRGEARGRTVAGAVIPTPWECRCNEYKLHDGILIPIESEVAWILPEGAKPYWRGRISRLSYEFAQ